MYEVRLRDQASVWRIKPEPYRVGRATISTMRSLDNPPQARTRAFRPFSIRSQHHSIIPPTQSLSYHMGCETSLHFLTSARANIAQPVHTFLRCQLPNSARRYWYDVTHLDFQTQISDVKI